jgi:lysophospholipase L1-like esterase
VRCAAFVLALGAAGLWWPEAAFSAETGRMPAGGHDVQTVVSIGDSIPYGFGLRSPATQSYAARYARHAGARLLNLAVPGVTCADVAHDQVPKIPRDASTVIVNCGTNDIGGFGFMPSGLPDGTKRAPAATDAQLAAVARRFARMIAAVHRTAPRARIVLVNLRHWQRMTGTEAPQFGRDVRAWNAMLAATRLPVVDASNDRRLYRTAYIQPDLLHPNAAGHEAIANDLSRTPYAAGR